MLVLRGLAFSDLCNVDHYLRKRTSQTKKWQKSAATTFKSKKTGVKIRKLTLIATKAPKTTKMNRTGRKSKKSLKILSQRKFYHQLFSKQPF